MDLRSSTEELYFMEVTEKNNKSENRDQISHLPQTQVIKLTNISFI